MNIPENFYHITTLKNYLKMGVSNEVKTSLDGCFGKSSGLKGVFMTDMPNYVSNWRYSKNWSGHLGFSLLRHAAKKENRLVCLKIPSKNLSEENIIVRSQNKLFDFIRRKQGDKQHAFNGIELKNAKDSISDTEAVEYIYTKSIPWDDVEIVGMADARKLAKRLPRGSSNGEWTKETLKEFFKNKSELNFIV